MMVSVCIATRNGENFIEAQLRSILSQLNENDEVIVSDDCSTDQTTTIIRSLNDSRVTLLEVNYCDLIRNFENALLNASGDIIFLADQDDLWHPTKVNKTKELLKKYDLVVTDADIINEEGVVIKRSLFSILKSGNGILKNIIKNTYVGCCMAFNRNVLDKAIPFPRFVTMHDAWIGMIGEVFGTTYFRNEALVYHRRHPLNASLTTGESSNNLLIKIRHRWNLVTDLLWRYISVKYNLWGG